MRTILFLLGATVASTPVAAYDPYDPANCNGVAWKAEHIVGVGRVSQPRVNFVKSPYDDDFKAAACPSENEACRKTSYVVSGDLVLMGDVRGPFSCIAYRSPTARKPAWANGWLPSAALVSVAAMPAPKVSDWMGTWGPHARITIGKADGSKLKIEGVKVVAMPSGDTNHGVFSARVTANVPTLAFTDDNSSECSIRLQRVGAYLLVDDNGGCGGSGANFTGLYRRTK